MIDKLQNIPWATLGRNESYEEFSGKLDEQKQRLAYFPKRVEFSIVVIPGEAVYENLLPRFAEALIAQSYPNWECVFVADKLLQTPFFSDARFRPLSVGDAKTAPAIANALAAQTHGDWVLFLELSDVLSPCALYEVALKISVPRTKTNVVFSNESFLADDPKSQLFFSKGDWSRINLMHFEPMGRAWWVRRDVFQKLDGFDEDLHRYWEKDFFLRLIEHGATPAYLPKYLLYREMPCCDHHADPEEQVDVVTAHLERSGTRAQCLMEQTPAGEKVRVIPQLNEPRESLVSAIICFRDRSDWTIQAVENLWERRGQVPLEVLLVDNGSKPSERQKIEQRLGSDVQIISMPGPFNFAHLHNVAVKKHAKGNFLLLLNNDVFLQSGNIDEWVAWAAQPETGTVGVRLLFPDGNLQHGGLRAFYGGGARMARIGHVQEFDELAFETHEVFGTTFAACLFRRELFDRLGGLRPLDLPNGFGDVAFSLECKRLGLQNIYLGSVEGTHLESASRGTGKYEYWEECTVEEEYADLIQKMLRADLGYDRVPLGGTPLETAAREVASAWVRRNAPWLKTLKAKARPAILKDVAQKVLRLKGQAWLKTTPTN